MGQKCDDDIRLWFDGALYNSNLTETADKVWTSKAKILTLNTTSMTLSALLLIFTIVTDSITYVIFPGDSPVKNYQINSHRISAASKETVTICRMNSLGIHLGIVQHQIAGHNSLEICPVGITCGDNGIYTTRHKKSEVMETPML